MMYGAIEAGGTKMVCAVGDQNGKIIEKMETPTITPEQTMPVILAFFQTYKPECIGIGSFGPVEIHPESDRYGTILTCPKFEWQGFDFRSYFEQNLNARVVVDTDVNVAALGEQKLGALRGIQNGVYLTIGTGVGGGVIAEGNLVHGMLHPETGHILLQRHPDDTMEATCRFHPNCLEGLAAGPAIERRAGRKGSEIPEDSPIWDMESYYIAQALVTYTMVLSTQRFILGGGVMKQLHLFPKIRKEYVRLLNGYLDTKELKDMETFIMPAALKGEQGILGALYLAIENPVE